MSYLVEQRSIETKPFDSGICPLLDGPILDDVDRSVRARPAGPSDRLSSLDRHFIFFKKIPSNDILTELALGRFIFIFSKKFFLMIYWPSGHLVVFFLFKKKKFIRMIHWPSYHSRFLIIWSLRRCCLWFNGGFGGVGCGGFGCGGGRCGVTVAVGGTCVSGDGVGKDGGGGLVTVIAVINVVNNSSRFMA